MTGKAMLGAVFACLLLLSACGGADSGGEEGDTTATTEAPQEDTLEVPPDPEDSDKDGSDDEMSEMPEAVDPGVDDSDSDLGDASDSGAGDGDVFDDEFDDVFGDLFGDDEFTDAAVHETADRGDWGDGGSSQAHLPGFIEIPWTPNVDLDCWLDAMSPRGVATQRAEAIARQLGIPSGPPPYRMEAHRTDGISGDELDAAVSSVVVCATNDPFDDAPDCATASEASDAVAEDLVRAWLLNATPGLAVIQVMEDCREESMAEVAAELEAVLGPEKAQCAAAEFIDAFLEFYRASYEATQAATPAESSPMVEEAAADLFMESTVGMIFACDLTAAEVEAMTGIDPATIPKG